MAAKKVRIAINCQHCNNVFEVLPSRVNKILYCSPQCGKLGGNTKRSVWGLNNRSTASYRTAQSVRTKRSWQNEISRQNHLKAMSTPEYSELRSNRAKEIVLSDVWIAAIQKDKESGEAKRRVASRTITPAINWRKVNLNGKEYNFRSGWEEAVARFLSLCDLYWEYEPEKIILADGSSYLPDFYVVSPFGKCYLEPHRILNIKPGDEEKVQKLLSISANNLLKYPLIILDEECMKFIFNVTRFSYGGRVTTKKNKDRLRHE